MPHSHICRASTGQCHTGSAFTTLMPCQYRAVPYRLGFHHTFFQLTSPVRVPVPASTQAPPPLPHMMIMYYIQSVNSIPVTHFDEEWGGGGWIGGNLAGLGGTHPLDYSRDQRKTEGLEGCYRQNLNYAKAVSVLYY